MKKFLFILISVLSFTLLKGQSFKWTKHVGGTGFSQGWAIASDNYGNVYSTGFSTDTTYFDLPSHALSINPNNGAQFSYITKNDSLGNSIWIKKLGGASQDFPQSIVVDDSGNVYSCGFFSDTTDFDPGPGTYFLGSTNYYTNNAYISKLDASGNFVYAKKIEGTLTNYAISMTVDDSSNVLLTGYFEGTADMDPGAGVMNLTSAGSEDVFILKLNSAGNFVWAKQIGGTGLDRANAVKADHNGNVFITGRFQLTVDFDPGAGTTTFTAAGSDDAFVSKFDPSGNFVWAKYISGISEEYGNSITVDDANNCYVAGLFNSTTNFDPGGTNLTIGTSGSEDIFIAKYSATGNFTWLKNIGGSASDYPNSIFYRDSNLYITGCFDGTVDFDPSIGSNLLYSAGSLDIFISKMDISGNFIWATQMGGSYSDYGYAVTVDPFNNVYSTGFFEFTADLNPELADTINYTSAGNQDVYINRMSQNQCSNMALLLDSFTNISCASPGYATTHAISGLAPYSYAWNTSPATIDSTITFPTEGIYELTVTDMNSCIKTVSFLVNAPDSLPGFDLKTNLVATDFRPGFSANIWVDAFNNNCAPVSGSLKFIYDSTYATLNFAIPLPDSIHNDTLIWNFSNATFDSLHLTPHICLQTNTSAAIGDTMCLRTIITPLGGDIDSTNNIKDYCLPIINGFDPNDKAVYPKGNCTPGYILNTQLLTYTIRFQNTGNASAININVLDTLDTDLDLSTVKIVGHSHPIVTEVLPGHVLKFKFENILLPDSTTDEPNSHGYVIYEVLPNTSAVSGSEIKNMAYIYFDYNPAVVTNTELNTLVTSIPVNCIPAAIDNFTKPKTGIQFYPNPSATTITIETTNPIQLKIMNVLGETVLTTKIETKKEINIQSFNNGVYFLISSDGSTQKLIKQ